MKHLLLILFFLFTLLRCSLNTSAIRQNNSNLSWEEIKADPNYSLAEIVDSELKSNNTDLTQLKKAKTECLNNPSPLCPLLKKLNTFKKLYQQKQTVFTPRLTRPLAPVIPNFKAGKITNWTALRKSPVPNLLKGFLAIDKEQLLVVAETSLKEKKCPNNAAVATAATLEDYLPNDANFPMLANLYETGGSCRKLLANDKENYLTRAGLFYFLTKNYLKASEVLSKVKATDAYSGRSVYWLYRARKEMGDTVGAQKALNRLATQHRFSFHNLVSAHQEQREAIPEFNRTLAFSTRSQKYKAFNRYIEGVEILYRLNFQESASLIVDWLLTQPKVLEPEVRVSLAKMGDAHARVIQMPGLLMFHPNLLSRETLTLNFPETYTALFEKYAKRVSPYLLMAIARRESSFNPKAISPANAQGLLQLNPETVKVLFPEGSFNLLEPETNISIASHYLAKVFEQMNENLPATLASYNAGEAQVHTWQQRYPAHDRILWIDLIPYRETRDYVANVLNSYHWYRKIYENNSDFSDLLL